MTFRRAPPVSFLDERKRVTTVVTLLITIAKRASRLRGTGHPEQSRRTPDKNHAGRNNNEKTKCKYKDIGPLIYGPLLRKCGVYPEQAKRVEGQGRPCFYLKSVYH